MKTLAATSVLALLALLAAGCGESEGRAEARYYGRTLGEWFSIAEASLPDPSRAPLREPGELAPDARVALAAFQCALEAPDRGTRQAGAAGIRRFGPAGAAAAPALVRALREDRETGRRPPEILDHVALDAFEGMGAAAVDLAPDLLDLLRRTDDADPRSFLVHGLGRVFGSMGTAVAPLLIEALEDEDPRVRAGAAAGLTRLGRSGKLDGWEDAAMPVLLRLLRSSDASDRGRAIGVLCHLGPEASPAIPELRRMLAEDAEVRDRIAMLFPRLRDPQPPGPEPERRSLDEIRTLLADPETCQDGLGALRRLGSGAAAAVPDVVAVLDRDENLDWEVADTLAVLDADPERTVPALVRIIRRDEGPGRRSALVAVGKLGPRARGATPAVVEALADVRECGTAADALAAIGARCDEALPALRGLLEDRRAEVRRAAANALRVVAGETEPMVPVLAACLGAETWFTRQRAAANLGEVGPAAAVALAALRAAAEDPVEAVREAAGAAIRAIEPEGR
jgi:HEAT repeat protein